MAGEINLGTSRKVSLYTLSGYTLLTRPSYEKLRYFRLKDSRYPKLDK